MYKLKHFIEWHVFGVCTAIGERMGIATTTIRKYFIYLSFATIGSPVIVYFFLAFWMNVKRYVFNARRNPVRYLWSFGRQTNDDRPQKFCKISITLNSLLPHYSCSIVGEFKSKFKLPQSPPKGEGNAQDCAIDCNIFFVIEYFTFKTFIFLK